MAKQFTSTTISLMEDHLHQVQTISDKNHIVVEKHEVDYPLHPISLKDLFLRRKSREPGFVLKINDDLFYTDVPFGTRLVCEDMIGKSSMRSYNRCHLCSDCKFLSAAPDSEGGCAKVRDICMDFTSRSYQSFNQTLKKSKRIEKYKFITYGYESFNTAMESLAVLSCEHFLKCN